MDKETYRRLGIILGVLMLVAAFIIPFGSGIISFTQVAGCKGPAGFCSNESTSSGSASFFDIASSVIGSLNDILAVGGGIATYSYAMLAALVILVAAALLGIRPLLSGLLGALSMLVVTFAPTFIGAASESPSYGAGYFVIWALSIGCLLIYLKQWSMKPSA